MGIKGLIPFLNEKVPGCMCELTLQSLSGEYVAVDASTALYQFSIAIRDSSYFNSLVNANGESTSHLYGLMSRSLKLLESGIKPVFVFDSKPPDLKLKTLDKRRQKREEAKDSLKQAIFEGDVESIKKLVGRTVKVSKEMNDSAKKLLKFMGLPVIEALEEAEAQCAYLVRNNLCRFVASEDTDTLVFGGTFLLRNVTASSNKKILKVDLEKVLAGLELTFDRFVDFCILCGCDYCDTLEGVGPKTAYTLVKRYNTLEDIVRLKGANYEDYREAREYFLAPKVNEYDQGSVKMGTLDVEALTEFLVTENNFAKERVDRFIEKLLKLKTKKVQTSLLSFLSQSSTFNIPVKDLGGRRGKSNKVTTTFRTNNKGTGTKRLEMNNVEEREKTKSVEGKGVGNRENNTEREMKDGQDEDDEFFDKLFSLDGEYLDQSAGEEVEKRQKDNTQENSPLKDVETSVDNKTTEGETEETGDQTSEEVTGEDEAKAKKENKERLERKEFEEQGIELKLFNSKRVLEEDNDNMSTATSEKMNCNVSDLKGEEKKGLRNLFDVLLPYPKPTKNHKN